jgi:hypothetical protein
VIATRPFLLRLLPATLPLVGSLVVWLCAPARADWPPTGAPVAPGRLAGQYPFTICSDGEGGIFVSWSDFYLFASRVTREGDVAPGWPAEGLKFGGYSYYHLASLSDDAGGMFVVFNAKDCVAHCAVDPAERRVLRLTGEGTLSQGWPEHGVPVGGGYGPVATGAGDIGRTAAIPDGRGGLIVAWGNHIGQDRRNPVELRVQRMDGRGTRLWGDSGKVVRTATLPFPLHTVSSDGRGGAILIWLDARQPHLFAQRISPEGVPQWTPDGLPLARDSVVAFSRPVVVEDGSRGAIVAWFGAVARDTGIFAIHVTAGGGLPWREPLLVHPAPSGVDWLQMVPADNGDAILAWRDARTPAHETIHAQRVSHGGRREWGCGGLPVCTAPSHKDYLALAPDDLGGAYVAWGDTRPAGEVFATHLDARGITVCGWDPDGTPVCPPVAAVWAVSLANDGAGNAIVAWTDERIPTGGYPLRVTQAMRLFAHGPATRVEGAVAGVTKPHPMRLSASESTAPEFRLRGLISDRGVSDKLVSFALPDAAPAKLEVYDVAGRRVWTRDVGYLGAGEHAIRLADGAWLPPGVYLARLMRNGEVATARMAIVR